MAHIIPLPSDSGRQGVGTASVEAFPLERRCKARYPLELPIGFRILDGSGKTWDGQVANISSAGVLVISHHQPKVGAAVEIRIAWPSLLDQRVPLQFIAIGKVVRRGPLDFAVLFRQHQFRTMATRPATLPDGTLSGRLA